MLLLIDNYDSFTWNLYHYLSELGAEVVVHRNDAVTVEEALDLKPDAIVITGDLVDGTVEELAKHAADAELVAVFEALDQAIDRIQITVGREARIEMRLPLQAGAAKTLHIPAICKRLCAGATARAVYREFRFAMGA